MHKLCIFVILFGVILVSGNRIKRQVQTCKTPNNLLGSCVNLENCPLLENLYNMQQRSYQNGQFLITSYRNCGSRNAGDQPIVCCQKPTNINNDIAQASARRNNEVSTTTLPPTIATTQTSGTECVTQLSEPGECIELAKCEQYHEILRDRRKDANEFLRKSNAICHRASRLVCCPKKVQVATNNTEERSLNSDTKSTTYRLMRPIEDSCGLVYNGHGKIVGGEKAELNAWPWMALIGYTNDFNETNFSCGGSLITQRHILTAAHCIKNTLTHVRLGEHDLSTTTETNHEDIRVSRVIKHSEFSVTDGHSDIAILVLERDVQYKNGIAPICIPYEEPIKSRSFIDYNPFVTGWGKTLEHGRSADILQVLQIPVLKNEECRKRYAARKRLRSARQFNEGIICAGILTGGRDSCQGDSGGPLAMPQQIKGITYYFQIGVVSYGIGCAHVDVPGIYTSVQYFSDWIAQKVAEPV